MPPFASRFARHTLAQLIRQSITRHVVSTSASRQQVRSLHAAIAAAKKVDFLLADVGEGIAEVEVLQWHVAENDTIAQFDAVCDVQSDKATVDITSRYDGVVTKLYYEEGEVAKVGAPLMQIEVEGDETDDSAVEEPAEATADADASTPAATTVKVMLWPRACCMPKWYHPQRSTRPQWFGSLAFA
eukprot:TRINITY_DN8715_c0_g1_i4.p3 TRINITY_DN8715_c0_g1~~TRINITY_DN8715_c0_g1_i4.p3  ORF type:complete len:186 (+),score=39.37 TRINITY_DN8715_c0_g1_i4:154-711(+)